MQGMRRGWAHSLVVLAAVVLVGCSESMGPLDETPSHAPTGGDTNKPPYSIGADAPGQDPDLGSCTNLALPRASKLFSHVYAKGDQVYRWAGNGWLLFGPAATLYHDATYKIQAGSHYVGPTWEANNGSKVYGSIVDRCTPDAGSIAWLLLKADSSAGPSFYKKATFIHRVNTVGGLAPSRPGNFINEFVAVPYTTEYFFYRDK